jgi:hypothetical protein
MGLAGFNLRRRLSAMEAEREQASEPAAELDQQADADSTAAEQEQASEPAAEPAPRRRGRPPKAA